MGFETLLGNQRLKDNLSAGVSRGRVSHFYLICGPVGSGKHTLARLIAAAALCREATKPCLRCSACRKVMAGTHPDYITVDDPEKKTVSVELVRQARADIYVQPNEGDKKIYLFPRAQDMGIPGQNALLKVLEEPPAYGVFLLLTDNPEKILPTVRSRCTELSLQALPRDVLHSALLQEFPGTDKATLDAVTEQSGGYLGQAKALLQEGLTSDPRTEAFVKAFAERDTVGLLQVLVPMEKTKRDQLITTLQGWKNLLQQALLCRSGMQTLSEGARALAARRSSADLLKAVRELEKTIEYTQGNVSPAAVCGYLAWALR